MSVWRKQTVQYLVNGKRAAKSAKGAIKRVVESKRFYGTLTLANGKRNQVPLTMDVKTSRMLLKRRQHDEDRKRALGIEALDENRSCPVLEALNDYVAFLTTKGNSDEYLRETELRLRKLFKATKTKTLSDLDSGRILRTLAAWRTGKRSISIATCNHFTGAVKSFTRWLVRESQLRSDPLIGLQKMNADVDRRRIRRAFSEDELKRLLLTTQISRKTYRGDDWQFTCADRVMLYTLGVNTGLRAKELASLTKDSFDFETKTLTLLARHTKNRRRAVLPLSETIIEPLQAFLGDRKTQELFPGRWTERRMAGKMIVRDMKRANIDRVDAQGRVLDFHSLRYTFISALARGGVHPSIAQRLARHSSIDLTMNVYTFLDVDDLRGGVNSLSFGR